METLILINLLHSARRVLGRDGAICFYMLDAHYF